jgi:hypothetical protein
MNPNQYSTRALWAASVKDAATRRASFFPSGFVVLAFFGLIAWWVDDFPPGEAWKVLLPLAVLLPVTILAWVLGRRLGRKGRRSPAPTRVTVLTYMAFHVLFILGLSAYLLRIGLSFTWLFGGVPSASPIALLSVYALSAVLAVVWAPRSLPRSVEDVALAAKREARWLPLALGCQGFLISVGVFLSAWLLHNEVRWENLLVVGLAGLTSTLLLFFGVLGVYRYALLVLSPMTGEVDPTSPPHPD